MSDFISSLIKKSEQQAETIKGLDRATVEYNRIIAEKDKRIAQLENSEFITIQYIKTLKKSNKESHDRIASLLEAQASIPTRDVNGTIEALHGLVAKLKGDVLKLQAKVTEQDDTIARLKPRTIDLSQPVAGTSGSEVVDILMDALDNGQRFDGMDLRKSEQTK